MDSQQTPRINLYLSRAGLGSRRQVEQLVVQGRVQIDGEVVHNLAKRVDNGQMVRVDGRIVHQPRGTVVFALHKPPRVICSTRDERGRPLAVDLVRPYFSGRLFSVGRLDFLTSGLLLFTNDGLLSRSLTRPQAGIEREYLVESKQPIPNETLHAFIRGVRVDGVKYRAKAFDRKAACAVRVTLTEGKNREIRAVFGYHKITIQRIHRTRFGTVHLSNMPAGAVRRLEHREIMRLTALAIRQGSR